MKVLVFFLWGLFAACGLAAEKPATVTWEGKRIEEITDVHLNPDGKIIVIYSGGGFSTTEDKLPAEFLKGWGISEDNLSTAKTARVQAVQDDLDRAIRAGKFRVVNGIVYDVRRSQPDWVFFQRARILQVTERGAIVDSSPDQAQPSPIFVRNLPPTIGDTEVISFQAILTGSFSYVNKLGYDRTIRAYDLGRPCTRDEIPDAIIKEKRLWGAALIDGKATRSALAQLPDGEELSGNGTGFFITTNGYLLSNWHVVRNSRKIKIRNRDGVFPAEIITTDKEKDLALLKVSGGPFPVLFIANEDSVALGESAFTIGFPNVVVQGLEPKYTDGKISSLAGAHDDPSQYQVSVPIQPGNSGGPLMGRSGEVIGVIEAKLNDLGFLATSGTLPQNVNYAIKAKVVREFLGTLADLSLPRPKAPLKPEEAVANTERAVVMVLVYSKQ